MARNINLNIPDARASEALLTLERAVLLVGACAVLSAIIAGGLEWHARSVASSLATLEAADKGRTGSSALTTAEQLTQKAVDEAQARLDARRRVLAAFRAGEAGPAHGYSSALLALARATRDGVWLSNVTLEQDHATLTGKAIDPQRINGWLDGLREQPEWSGRRFDTVEIKAAAQREGSPPDDARPRPVEFKLVATGAMRPGRDIALREGAR